MQEMQGCVEGEKAQDAATTDRRKELLQKHEQAAEVLAARLEQDLEVTSCWAVCASEIGLLQPWAVTLDSQQCIAYAPMLAHQGSTTVYLLHLLPLPRPPLQQMPVAAFIWLQP